LSALLANKTGNTTYLESVQETGSFLLNGFQIDKAGNGYGGLSADLDASCEDSPSWRMEEYTIQNVGVFLIGLAYLSDDASIDSRRVDDLYVLFFQIKTLYPLQIDARISLTPRS
jgi:hypothetical protein